MKKTNNRRNKIKIIKELQTIPGVGKTIANDLYLLGFRSVNEIKNKNPEKMYADYCKLLNQSIDKCLLYVFRCAVYFASNKNHSPELLLWWNWKDKN